MPTGMSLPSLVYATDSACRGASQANGELKLAGVQFGVQVRARPGKERTGNMQIRPATNADIPELRRLIAQSARALSVGFYSARQIDAAVAHVFGVDSQLIADGTYFVIEEGERLVAAGGWSWRQTLYGGDQTKRAEDPPLDPATDAARIRAFFVHPEWARRGLGRRLYEECATAAWSAGFMRFELLATRPGEPLYYALGFVAVEQVTGHLPGGVDVEFSRMERPISGPAPEASHETAG